MRRHRIVQLVSTSLNLLFVEMLCVVQSLSVSIRALQCSGSKIRYKK